VDDVALDGAGLVGVGIDLGAGGGVVGEFHEVEEVAGGVVAARSLPLNPRAGEAPQLEAGEWSAALTYRYLHADKGYIGSERWANSDAIVARTKVHSFDLQAAYAFNSRYSVALTAPFVYGERSSVLDHDGTRHTTRAGGLSDMRLMGYAWLFGPERAMGNVSVGIGMKAPTGDSEATDTFYKPTGREVRPVDQAIQPGDGGWGIELELLAYQKIVDRLYGYVSGAYLINPRETNDAYTTAPYPPGPNPNGAVRPLSVPDQYLGRIGLSYHVWPEKGLSVSIGGRVDGVPSRDLVGGSEGFRRPGYAVSIEPGVSWAQGKNAFNIFTPVLVAANKTKNIYDDRYGTHGPAAFADFVIIATLSRRF
jgi:hypothetical protein